MLGQDMESGTVLIKDCVIFSSFVPSPSKIWVGEYYLKCFIENFADCDVFVGVSSKSCPEWISFLENFKSKHILNLEYGVASSDHYIDSDATGYQKALELLRQSGNRYKTILFMHTKCVTHGGSDSKNLKDMDGLKSVFLTKEVRRNVDSLFSDSRVGLFSTWCTKATDPVLESLDKFFKFWYTGNKLMIVDSTFFMRGSLVHQFIHNCDKSFFESNLLSLGFDRYFFERDFPTLCFRLGQEYRVKGYMTHPSWYTFDENQFNEMIVDWRKKNSL